MKNKIKTAVVIPARMASTRFPGKPLAKLCGKPMIQWVYEKSVASTADAVIIATDDERIKTAVEGFGGLAIMTSTVHQSGTDRIAEAVKNRDYGIIINVQGDEPLIPTVVINELIEKMQDCSSMEMATVAVERPRSEIADDPNKVKVVFDAEKRALYFSRCAIPFVRESGCEAKMYLHWGIYAYRRSTLEKFVSLPTGILESYEKLEQLRALENGIDIYVLESNLESIGVDTPEDLLKAEKKLENRK
ncbi:MAG: 3-deoxy-manno-octulosonate cytidylyltransferase [Victivallaceae bacterium]|nr:3-deoxy-manno-octulosonate cytidylyltransferase [Victivallaceae bacterium]MDD3116214.1 3-deoxy-manno-octulosonate cytidylyltransferase [Victivallaceae bacterium]MDD3703148.1 3-deoxy-manno-octulosonate cytidylyltransferase [Victivallaceae bacterium]MDD5663902.1 3-deoxy-manno-octulosonate cytidylyltransferase [Victivallaceae bacterium]